MFLYPSAAPVCISIRACVILLHVCAEENVAFLHQSAPLSFHVHQDSKAVCCLPLTSYTLVVFFFVFFFHKCVFMYWSYNGLMCVCPRLKRRSSWKSQ